MSKRPIDELLDAALKALQKIIDTTADKETSQIASDVIDELESIYMDTLK